MTMTELLAMPNGMRFEEYEKLLDEKQKLEKKIRRASNTIFDEEESLEVLADEVGSERYNKHLVNKQKAEAKKEKAKAKLEQIEKKLNT
jgi:hypothetical protein